MWMENMRVPLHSKLVMKRLVKKSCLCVAAHVHVCVCGGVSARVLSDSVVPNSL